MIRLKPVFITSHVFPNFKRYLMTETNTTSQTNRAEKTLTKFWTNVNVEPYTENTVTKGLNPIQETGNVITLDGKPIKTPAGFPLVVPNHRNPALSHLVAQEWSSITSTSKIKNYALPLTSLTARAIDLKYSENGPNERSLSVNQLLPYLDTDAMLVFSPRKDCDGTLRTAQEEQYRPLIQLAENFWNTELSHLDTEIVFYGNNQTEETRKKVIDWISSLDPWQFSALERATTAAKSLIGGMLVITKQRTPNEVANLVNLETSCQTAYWGEVEDTHDVQYADIRRLLGSSFLVA